MIVAGDRDLLTSLNFCRLHVFSWHGVAINDVGQCGRCKVFFTRLFLRSMLPGILLHALEAVNSSAIFIMRFLIKVA